MKQTAGDLFNKRYPDVIKDKHDKRIHRWDYYDMIEFAEEYASLERDEQPTQEGDKSFMEYIKEARKWFAHTVAHYDTKEHNTLRTECDNILIAYDQMADKLSTPLTESRNKPIEAEDKIDFDRFQYNSLFAEDRYEKAIKHYAKTHHIGDSGVLQESLRIAAGLDNPKD